MKRSFIIIGSLLYLIFTRSAGFALNPDQTKDFTFPAKETVKIKLVLGDCYLKASKDRQIHIHLTYTYNDDQFEPLFKERQKSLLIQEKLYGDNPRGRATWNIEIPLDLEIDFSTATGDLVITEWQGEIEANSGTGDIDATKFKGEFKLNSGTGSITIKDCDGKFDANSGTGTVTFESCKGNFKGNSGTGTVQASNIVIEDDGDFNSGTGKSKVNKPQGTDFDLSVNSGTGDAVVDMQGLPLEGYFEFTAHARKGSIDSPVKFDEEKEYQEGDNWYYRKSFTRGKKTPRYYISTGTGTAELKK